MPGADEDLTWYGKCPVTYQDLALPVTTSSATHFVNAPVLLDCGIHHNAREQKGVGDVVAYQEQERSVQGHVKGTLRR